MTTDDIPGGFSRRALDARLLEVCSAGRFGLRVGDLTSFRVLAVEMSCDAYLVSVGDGGLLGLLPRDHAARRYLPGESGWAAIFKIVAGRVILSRTSPQFIRKMLGCLLFDFLNERGIRLKRAARLRGAPFCKVAVETVLSQVELAEAFRAWGPARLNDYVSATVILVKYSSDLEEYVVNALFPAPAEAVRGVSFLRESNRVVVEVESSASGRFLGRRGWNVATAARLTGVAVEVVKNNKQEEAADERRDV